MDLTQFIHDYGYLALFVGTFLEGETILVLAGFAAYRGYLDLPWVMLVAAIGTFLGDQMFFLLGRFLGRPFLERKPSRALRVKRVRELLHRHRILVLICYRYLYGLRSVTPAAIGASGFPPWIFAFWSAIGAVVWAIGVGILGYFFGRVIEQFLEEVDEWEFIILLGLAAVGLIASGIHIVRGRLRARTAIQAGELPPPAASAPAEVSSLAPPDTRQAE